MPYILLVLGLLIGAYALYRFFLRADVRQIKALFLMIVCLVLAIALFFMAITGRLPAAIALIAALIPFAIGYIRNKYGATAGGAEAKETPVVGSHAEALEVLGLEDGASEGEVQAAYKRLMQKVHPDHEGSEWMAAKLNAARDLLLDKSSRDA